MNRNGKPAWARSTTKVALWAGAGAAGAAGAYLGWQAVQRASIRRENSNVRAGNIVILGAGFAGMYVARELARLLPDSNNGRITLVDEHPYLLFTPMLTEAAGGEIDIQHIVSPVRQLPTRVDFVQGRIDRIDLPAKTVTLTVGERELSQTTRTLEADHLVIALGSVTNFHHIPGIEQHSLTMKSLGDAAAVLHRALAILERASVEPDENTRRAMLTFVVGGGGYTGAETMAALNDLVRDTIGQYPQLRPEEIRTVLIEPGERLLAETAPELAAYAQQKLQERQVEVMLKTEITGAGEGYVEIKGGQRIPAQTLIWTAGVKPSPVVDGLGLPTGKHGGVSVDSCCAVPGHPGLWALGDCAEVPQPGGKGTYAPTAQNATREGTLVARNLVAALRGEKPRSFVYEPIGELALVGKRVGVARVYGHNFSGFIAWAMWRAIYLAKMPGVGQRARILADWLLDCAFGRPEATLPTERGNAA